MTAESSKSNDIHRNQLAIASGGVDGSTQRVLAQVEESLRGLKFGQVILSIQNGVVVQIERIERIRLNRPAD